MCRRNFQAHISMVFQASKSRKSKDREVGTVRVEEPLGVWLIEWRPFQIIQRDCNVTHKETMGEECTGAYIPMYLARLLFEKDALLSIDQGRIPLGFSSTKRIGSLSKGVGTVWPGTRNSLVLSRSHTSPLFPPSHQHGRGGDAVCIWESTSTILVLDLHLPHE